MRKVLFAVVMFFTFCFHATGQESASDFIARGDEAFMKFDNKEALEWYEKAYNTDSTSYEASWKLSRAYVDVGETLNDKEAHAYYLKAQRFANRAIELQEEDSEGHLFLSIALGRVALKAGPKERMSMAKSIKWEADKALQYDPDSDLAYHVIGRWHRKLANLSWVEKGFANMFLGGIPKEATMENAVASFKKAIEINPNKINHHLELGITYENMGMDEEAIKEFQICLDLPESDSDDGEHKATAKKYLDDLK